MNENCKVCGGPIKVQIQKNTDVCSGQCRKVLWVQAHGVDLTDLPNV